MWLVLAFTSAMLLGVYDVFKKISLKDNAVIPVLLLNTFFCSCIFLPLVILSAQGFIPEDHLLFIPRIEDPTIHLYIILKSAIVLASWICAYYGLKHLPITIASPINATRPILALLGAIFVFDEQLNGWQWAGVIVSLFAFTMISYSGKKEGISVKNSIWIWLVMAGTMIGAVSGLYDKFLVGDPNNGHGLFGLIPNRGFPKMVIQSWYNFYQVIMMGIVCLICWAPKRHRIKHPFHWRWQIPLISVFLSVADFCYFYALSQPDALISIISLVRRSGVIVGFLAGWLFFKEQNIKSKSIDLLFVVIAMFLLWMGTN
ncbi:MAG: DMT family transporter [Bacteroidales bacterium]|nr:DMT family transporter [Bacteroidales bacterium]